jgi:nucleoside-diphosphate-sugar epimerase
MVTAAEEASVRKFVYTSTMDVFDYEPGSNFDESKVFLEK